MYTVLQVGKTEKCPGICVVRKSPGNVGGKYYFWKVRENDFGSCRLQATV